MKRILLVDDDENLLSGCRRQFRKQLIRHVLPRRIRLQLDCVPNLRPIAADESMLGQVVLNLALNARDAMPKDGTLKLEAAPSEATRPAADGRSRRSRYVCLSVADTGCGMDAATKARLWPDKARAWVCRSWLTSSGGTTGGWRWRPSQAKALHSKSSCPNGERSRI
jgi:signal transduction histidine kinase